MRSGIPLGTRNGAGYPLTLAELRSDRRLTTTGARMRPRKALDALRTLCVLVCFADTGTKCRSVSVLPPNGGETIRTRCPKGCGGTPQGYAPRASLDATQRFALCSNFRKKAPSFYGGVRVTAKSVFKMNIN